MTLDGLHLPPSLSSPTRDEEEWTILVACGSFSPVTMLHLRIFEDARNYLQFDCPSPHKVVAGFLSPVHGSYNKQSVRDVTAQQRVDMCLEATASSDWVSVSAWETQQEEWTRTLFVLEHYRNILADHFQHVVRVKLLVGSDILNALRDTTLWEPAHRDRILREFGLVCITRDGFDAAHLMKHDSMLSEYQDCVHLVQPAVTNTVTSTAIRKLIREGKSAKYLVADRVLQYIHRHRIYL